jgi:3-oxoacyl-[acyl-carrier-protein] synthase III
MRARIIGAGSYVPENIVTNEMLAKVIPEWSAEIIEKKLGIRERRFMWPLDTVKGKAVPPADKTKPSTNVDMAVISLEQALAQAGLSGSDMDALLFVTCTPDEPLFSHDAMEIHQRLQMRSDCLVNEFESGCGGIAYQLNHARLLLESGACNRVALVASNATSPCFTGMHIYSDPAFPFEFDPDKPLKMALSAYVFGDGAGAIVLDNSGNENCGILNSYFRVDYGVHVFRSGGGIQWPGNSSRTENWRHGYYVDGKKVAVDYAKYMEASVRGALRGFENRYDEIERFYFHQVNRRILEIFLKSGGFDIGKVPIHVDRYANISAACTLVLLAEDIHGGHVQLGNGTLTMLAAMGAGVHYGGHLIVL